MTCFIFRTITTNPSHPVRTEETWGIKMFWRKLPATKLGGKKIIKIEFEVEGVSFVDSEFN
jgi:hypothetical protein